MSSVHEIIPWAGHVNYAASKGGIHMMMQTLAQEVAPDRIRVNAVAPGAIRTPINKEAWGTEEALKELLRLIPYGRIGEPEDIARAVTWLLSDEADYVTGATLFVVDAGVDTGPIVAQVPVAVAEDDDVASLHERIKTAERAMLVDAVGRIAREGITVEGRRVRIGGSDR